MRILTFLVVFLIFLAMTFSLFWSAWVYGRKFAAKHDANHPPPPESPDKNKPDRNGPA